VGGLLSGRLEPGPGGERECVQDVGDRAVPAGRQLMQQHAPGRCHRLDLVDVIEDENPWLLLVCVRA
jgi:hypothetical protein